MRFLTCLCAISAAAQTYNIQPLTPKQGDIVRIAVSGAPAASARLGKKTIRLFAEADGHRVAWMPIPAREKPGAYPLEILDDKGSVIHTQNVNVRDALFPIQNVQLTRRLVELKPAPGELDTVAELRNTVSETRYFTEPFTAPLPGCMVSPFGVRRFHNGKDSGNYHGGIDQRGAEGTPVHAITGGVVRIVRPFNVHGNTVGIDHGWGVSSLYLHLSQFAVKEGMKVAAGDVIGQVGSTGRSTAPHLHWNVNVNGMGVNPAQWITMEPCPKPAPAKKRPVRKKK